MPLWVSWICEVWGIEQVDSARRTSTTMVRRPTHDYVTVLPDFFLGGVVKNQ